MYQHMTVVDDMVAKHFLWCPQILDFITTTTYPLVKRTVIHLNDNRTREVVTCIGEEGDSIKVETSVSDWKRTV